MHPKRDASEVRVCLYHLCTHSLTHSQTTSHHVTSLLAIRLHLLTSLMREPGGTRACVRGSAHVDGLHACTSAHACTRTRVHLRFQLVTPVVCACSVLCVCCSARACVYLSMCVCMCLSIYACMYVRVRYRRHHAGCMHVSIYLSLCADTTEAIPVSDA